MTEWAKEYRNLKQRIQTMDKDVFKLLTFTKTTTLKNEIQGLIEFEERKEFEQHVEAEDLYAFISSLKKELVNLKENLRNYSKNPASLSKIQEITEKLEGKMSRFKEKQMLNFDRLLEEEEALSHDIELINLKLETYEAPVEITELSLIPKSKPNRGTSIGKQGARQNQRQVATVREDDDMENIETVQEVRNTRIDREPTGQELAKVLKEKIDKINVEIEKLGNVKNLGWENEDHQMFLKIRTKHKNNIDKIAFVNDCITSLPFYGEEDIQEHIQKFKKHLELEEEKKRLTKEYKENKENEKKNMIEMIKQEEMRKEEQERARMANLIKNKEEKEKTKEKLKEWRASKIAKLAVEEEKVKEIDVAKRKEKELAEKARKEAAQKKVQEFKEKRELEKIREKEKEEYKKSLQKRRLDKEELERLKEKEEYLMKKNFEKIALKKKKEEEKAMKMKKIMESNTHAYAYVEPKLNEETKAAVLRKREKFDPTKDSGRIGDTFGGDLTRKFGRAVPSWRNGL